MAPIVEVKYTQLFINNEFVDAKSGKTFPTINPATEEVVAQVAAGEQVDVDAAVSAARKAFDLNSEWRRMDASARGALLLKLAELMKRDAVYLAQLECTNNGKPFKDAIGEVYGAAQALAYYAGYADKIHGKTIPSDGGVFTYTRHEPIGVCGQIIPWNYPVIMVTWKIAPALACGNTVILKPAEQTPLTALYIAALAKEAGFPAGVLNVITGYGHTAGAAIASHMDVDKIAFTGSTDVGHKIQEASAKSNLKRVSLELGGKSPFIICKLADGDLQMAATYACMSLFHNQGQTCVAPTRVFVHEDVYDSFLEKAKAVTESLTVGDPFSDETKLGALISQEQFEKVLSYIESGKTEGARLITGGSRVGFKGFFLKPTIFADVQDNMKIAREEIFGPVMSVFKFSGINEVLRRANDTNYGLASGVYSNDIDTILQLSNGLQAGTVWVNCYSAFAVQAPFGGYKQSGFGREMGEYGLHEYTEVKTVTIKLNSKV